MDDERDVAADYESSLSELTFNSKPHINMLTMLAEEYANFAPKIVEVIETHLQKVLTIAIFVYSKVSSCPWGVTVFIMVLLTNPLYRGDYEPSLRTLAQTRRFMLTMLVFFILFAEFRDPPTFSAP